MAILAEMFDSRELTTERGPDGKRRLKKITQHHKLEGSADEGETRSTVEDNTSSTYDELVRGDIRIAPDVVDTVTDTGIWDVEVDYAREDDAEPAVGESSYSFDTAGGTQHITQSLETKHIGGLKYESGPGTFPAPNFAGAIRARKQEGKITVEGVDIGVGMYAWEETHYLPNSMVTAAYKANLFRLTFKTNQAPWRGFAAGEVLFRGARGGKRGSEDWEISFGFAASENKTNWLPPSLEGGEDWTGFLPFDKKGWDYLWVLYEDVEDAVAKTLVARPKAIYVERVYEEGDLSKLKI